MNGQVESSRSGYRTVSDLCRRLRHQVVNLRSAIANGIRPQDATIKYAEMHAVLSALPLTTEESTVAWSRLRNSIAYLLTHERTASRFELRMLLKGVERLH